MIRIIVLCLIGISLASRQAVAQEAIRNFGPIDAPPIIVRSTTDIAVFTPVIDAYLAAYPTRRVQYEQWGSNTLHEASLRDCTSQTVPADIVLSSAVHQMVELVNLGCATSYRSALTTALPDPLRWRDELWGITREAAVMIYNRALVPAQDIPATRFALLDLLRPAGSRYAGRVATYDIDASGLGYLFAFQDSLEATTFGALLESFGRSQAVATCCSAEIIDGVGDGDYLIAYNVLGSYALAANDPRIGIILPQDYTLVLSRALMIPRNADHTKEAEELLDFLLSPEGETALKSVQLISSELAQENIPEAVAITAGTPISPSVLRPIELGPTLLVARDSLTRSQFVRRWRETFPRK
jgi:iron(III) transport system substrate-binding protein